MRRTLIRGALTGAAVALTLPASAAATSVSTWGSNAFGQLGDGHTSAEQLYSDVAVEASGAQAATTVAVGCNHDLAVTAPRGEVLAWGRNNKGQLGYGTEPFEGAHEPAESDTPETVEGLTGAVEVAAGCNFSMARRSDGSVWVWGEWPAGLGKDRPTEVITSGATAIAAGDSCCQSGLALALMSNGTVDAWGYDGYFELGYPEVREDMSTTPSPVEGVSNATGIAAGASFGAALIKGGAVEVWGSNYSAEHGNGTVGSSFPCYCTHETAEHRGLTPTTVPELTEVASIAAGGEHILALLRGGTVKAWGRDLSGELGDGFVNELAYVPASVADLSSVASIVASRYDSLAVLSDGGVEAWGSNESGALGRGNTSTQEPLNDYPGFVAGLLSAAQPAGAAAAALAPANGFAARVPQWTSTGSVADKKLGASFSLAGTFTGQGALHGQEGGELTAPQSNLQVKLFGNLPVTVGTSVTPVKWNGGADARENLNVTSVSLLGLTIPTSCTTKRPLEIGLATPSEVGNQLQVAGGATISAFRCSGGFLGQAFSPILSALASGEGTYTLTLEA